MAQNMSFAPARREQAKLRLGIAGPSGSGKTFGSLLLAKGLGGKIALIDTERRSASLYDHLVNFDVMDLRPPYSPEVFVQALKAAEKAGYDVVIIDSMSQEWVGTGGCLQINDSIAHAKFRGNTWSAWSETTPRHQAFIDAINDSNMHVICCMRSKTETAQQDIGGKKQVVKLGMKPEQREGIEYEFTTVLNLLNEGNFAMASKDRTALFADPHVISEETGARLLNWLSNGAVMAPVASDGELVSDEQRDIIQSECERVGMTVANLCKKLNVNSIASIAAHEFNDVMARLGAYEHAKLQKQTQASEQGAGATA